MKYYSPTSEYHIIKRPKIFFRLINFLIRKLIGRNEIIWHTEKPDEAVVFVSNHTRTYAPLSMMFNFDLPIRPWANAYMLTYRNGYKIFYKKISYDFNPKFLRAILLAIIMPIINLYFRSMEPIPVYHDIRLRTTFTKTTETLNSGINVVIYPEKNIISPYKYANELENGFVHLAMHYYEATGKCVKFYPVYCCKDLKKILIGVPIEYNPQVNLKEQRLIIADYLCKKINELANSLPPHKPYLNKSYPPNIRFNF